MKPHVHCELIKLWADGAKIQVYVKSNQTYKDVDRPSWYEDATYRVKPREYEEGVCYPVIEVDSEERDVAYCCGKEADEYTFLVCGNPQLMLEDRFSFIGEPLPLNLWEV